MRTFKLGDKEYFLKLKHRSIEKLEAVLGYGIDKIYLSINNPKSRFTQKEAMCFIWASLLDSDMKEINLSYNEFVDKLDEEEVSIPDIWAMGTAILQESFTTKKKTEKPAAKIPSKKNT